jgi:hypothetical protein
MRRFRSLQRGGTETEPSCPRPGKLPPVTPVDFAPRCFIACAVAEESSAGNTAVRQVMSKRVYYCFEDDDVEQAAKVMAEHQVRRLPVLNRDKRLVGIVAVADLARSGAKQAEERDRGRLRADRSATTLIQVRPDRIGHRTIRCGHAPALAGSARFRERPAGPLKRPLE